MPRLRFRPRGLIISGTILIIACAVMKAGTDRVRYAEAADHYAKHAYSYEDKDPNSKYYKSCYGQKWDALLENVVTDRQAHLKDEAYRMRKAAEYHALHRKYTQAASRPWPWLSLDPPLRP